MKRLFSALLTVALCFSLTAPVSAADDMTVHASIRSPWVIVNGIEAGFLDGEQGRREAVTYGNMVYIPLATVGLWMGADTRWDANTRSVTITSNGAEPVYYRPGDFNPGRLDLERAEGVEQYQQDMKHGVDVILCPDVTVTVDGQIKTFASDGGTPLCPILFRACVYLPVSGVAELLGLNALWLERWDTVNLYAPEAWEAAGRYVAALRGHLNDVRTLLEENHAVGSDQEFVSYMEQLQASVQAIQSLPEPPCMTWYLDSVTFYTRQILSGNIEPYLPLNAVTSPSPINTAFWKKTPEGKWRTIKTKFISMSEKDTTSYFLSLEKVCAECEDFLSCAGSGAFFHPDPTTSEAETPIVRPEAAAAADPTRFTDAASITCWDAVSTLSQLGVLSGKDDGAFHPADPVTRAEAVKMVTLIMTGGREPDFPDDPAPLFSDTHGHWAEGYINFCSILDILDGRGDGSFAPDETVTGIQLAKLCLDMLGHDAAVYRLTGSAWAIRSDELARATVPSLYEGLEAMDINAPISKESTAQMLYNAMRCKLQMLTFSDEPEGTWEYKISDKIFFQEHFGLEALPKVPSQPGKA